jgi:predicted AlkP superfamily phosphohydrolase/phosphomutase
MAAFKKTIVIGLDGLEPKLVDSLLARGELPNLARLRASGGYARVGTTYPAQTPVAWSTFATGVNPGGHGIFDFIRRDPKTYLPNLGLNRYEQKNAFLPPKAVNWRRGATVWDVLSQAGVPSTILRCPCTYPAESLRGRLLAGMGVPDVRGGLGTSTFFTTGANAKQGESEHLVRLERSGKGPVVTQLPGPRHPRTGAHVPFPLTIHPEPADKKVTIRSDGDPASRVVGLGQWSGWLRVKFKMGLLQSIRGLVRFYLASLAPELELYASPVNFAPEAPMFPISAPAEYAGELASSIGLYYTTGMVEDHTGLDNGRFDERAYLDQCETVVRERERMMLHELGRCREGLFYCLFDTPDRIQHMFWRFGEPDHPANKQPPSPEMAAVIEEHYRRCDAVVGKALQHADDKTLFITLSDHGFNSFRRGVHVNTWLRDNGFLTLREGVAPGEEAGDLLKAVDWSRSRAYALGLGGIYLNLKGREGNGIVEPAEAGKLQTEIAERLTGLADADHGVTAVRSVRTREQVYTGPCAGESPDLVVNFAAGYRTSWATALGGVPAGHFEDNTRKWSGDHIVDPELVPGVLFINQPFDGSQPHLRDLAPTILAALGVPKGAAMEGTSLLQ